MCGHQFGGERARVLDSVDSEYRCADVECDHHGHQPHGAEGHDADEVGGLRLAANDGVVRRRQVVRQEYRRLVGDRVGKRGEHRVGMRDADQLGLGTIETGVDAGVADDARPEHWVTRPARQAAHVPSATRLDASPRDRRSVLRDLRDIGADFDDYPRKLVPHDRPILEARYVPVERSEIGAADRSRVDADDCVRSHETRDPLRPRPGRR